MRAIAVLLIIAAIGAGIYYFFLTESPAYIAYKDFATALARGDRNRALTYASSPDVLGGPEQNRGQFAGGMAVDALVDIQYNRESQTKNPDGSITVVALQSVRFDPVGVTSAMGAVTSKYRQTATLTKSSSGWVVTSFQSDLVESRNWKGEKL